jgi:hypothetical protein
MSEIHTDENGKEYTKEEMDAEIERRVLVRDQEDREIIKKLHKFLDYDSIPQGCGYPRFMSEFGANYSVFIEMIKAGECPILYMDGDKIVCALKGKRFVNRERIYIYGIQRVVCKTYVQWMESKEKQPC